MTQPIALQDVVAPSPTSPGSEALERTVRRAGLEVMTCLDTILRVGDLRGRRPPIVEVPVLTPRLSSLWLHLVTPVQADVARDLSVGLLTETHAGKRHRHARSL